MIRRQLAVLGALGALGVLATACSATSGEPTAATVVEPAAPAPTTTVPPIADAAPADAASAELEAEAVEARPTVAMTLSATGFEGGDVTYEAALDPDGVDGPFGTFASCSGLRDHVSAYSVLVSDERGAANVWTPDPVTAPGIYDAEVRLEPTTGSPLTATGTVTVLDGLQSGEFLAFGAAGGRIEGTFDCVGSAGPRPLAVGDPSDGALGSVEVFAVLRSGDAERVVGLVADASTAIECSAAAGGGPSGLVVRADGDTGLGAITTFELSDDPATVRLRVGGTPFEFTDVTLVLGDDGTTGTFSAVATDGTSAEGAFRCT